MSVSGGQNWLVPSNDGEISMSATNAVNFEKEIPDVFKTMAGATYAVHDLGFDRKLSHLVHLRASQMNN
jgi:hypothetical protein